MNSNYNYMKYYIASPFFDDASKAWVESKEEEFKGFNISFFSPRQDGVNFNKEGLTPELRAYRIRGIFQNNIRELQQCTNIVCNLNYCKGKVDIGTLFELGYFAGQIDKSPYDDGNNFIDCPKDFSNKIDKFLSDRSLYKELKNVYGTVLYISSLHDESLINETLSFWGLKEKISIIKIDEIDNLIVGHRTMFLMDDFPIETILTMGLFYQKHIPFYTCSFRGFGSNVMIAASSEGHMQIPGFVDDTYKSDIL